jgi:hypothetical protein
MTTREENRNQRKKRGISKVNYIQLTAQKIGWEIKIFMKEYQARKHRGRTI